MELKEIIKKIDFPEEALAQAHLEQAGLLHEASRYRIQKMRDRMKAEAEYNSIQASVALQLRRAKTDKITEASIRERTAKNDDVEKAKARADDAKAVEEYSKLLVEVFHSRGSMIKSLVSLLGFQVVLESKYIRDEFDRMGLRRLREKAERGYPGAKR